MLIEENFKEKGCVHLARAPNLHARPEHALSKSFCASCKERAFNTSPQKWLSLKLLVLIMCMAAMGLSGLRRWKMSLASNVFNLDPPSDMWGNTNHRLTNKTLFISASNALQLLLCVQMSSSLSPEIPPKLKIYS